MVAILHAGSLTRLVQDGLGSALQSRAGITIGARAGGSVMLANGIRDRSLVGDVFLSADATVNDALMGAGNEDRVRWFVTFASNSVVLAHYPRSRFAADFQRAKAGDILWHEVLRRPGLALSRGNPDSDPLAYYILMVCQLAETHYGIPGLKHAILGDDLNPAPIGRGVPQPIGDDVDAAFMYLNTAVNNDLPFITLPDEINLGNPALASKYSAASYVTSDTGQHFRGQTIAFSATVLEDATEAADGIDVVRFLLSAAGQQLVRDHHFRPGTLLVGGDTDACPATVRVLTRGRYPA